MLARRNEHISALDGFRGLAVLMVLLYHIFPYFKAFYFGWAGVDLFFVLSGFLITGILLDTRDEEGYYRNYLARRTLRIFPLYYTFLILFFVGFFFAGIGELVPGYEYLTSHQLWYWLYVQNWLAMFDENFPAMNFLSHFWSLAIEEQFYIFWPIVVFYVRPGKLLYVTLFLIVTSLCLRLYFLSYPELFAKVYIFTPTRLDGLAIGSAMACMVRNPRAIEWLNSNVKKIFFLSGAVIVATIAYTRSLSFSNVLIATYGYTVIDLFFGCLILIGLSQHQGNVIRRIAQTRILTIMGKYSYGLYVYHLALYRLLGERLNSLTNSAVLSSILIFTGSFVIAYLSFHGIEKHFLKLKSKFSRPAMRVQALASQEKSSV